jgi:two-component system, NarL family, response regulator LiaR
VAKAEKIRILVVDDHEVVRRGLRAFLGMLPDIEVEGEAASGAEALSEDARLRPDVVLMDLVMPGMDGIEATRLIRERRPDARVIVLTSFSDDDKIFPAIRAGAIGYLLKDVKPAELADTIRAAARGESRLAPDITRRVLSGISGSAGASGAPGGARDARELTERELDVLRRVARGMSNKEIGAELFIAEKTVKTHVSSILSTLGLADRTQAAVWAVKHGLE